MPEELDVMKTRRRPGQTIILEGLMLRRFNPATGASIETGDAEYMFTFYEWDGSWAISGSNKPLSKCPRNWI